MNCRESGKVYERQAACYLSRYGFVLLEANYRCRQGEVDLVGIHDECLVFVEVKYRKNGSAGRPEEAVDRKKQERICKASDYYRIRHKEQAFRQVRYDVVAICGEEIRWYQNAFPYCKAGSRFSW